VNDADHMRVQGQSPFTHPRKQRFQARGQSFHRIQIDSPSRALQAVRTAEGLIDLWSSLCFRHVFEQCQDRAYMFQMLSLLALKNGRKLLLNRGQSRNPSVASRSCVPTLLRLAADFSVCRLLMVACSLPRLRSFMACITFSNPICCWLVPATIC
jgi:hypothetical protein